MKHIVYILSFFIFSSTALNAQSIAEGIETYKNNDFESALEIFNQNNNATSLLYAGKSYYSLGELSKAEKKLTEAAKKAENKNIEFEAKYTLATVNFHTKNFIDALSNLFDITSYKDTTLFTKNAEIFYKDILNYLSENQIEFVFNNIRNIDIKTDLVATAIGRLEYDSIKTLLAKLDNDNNMSQQNYLVLEENIGSRESYNNKYNQLRKPTAPPGTVYKIGVSLPYFNFDSDEYEISQHLYFGIHLAVEEFNSANNDKKIFIEYHSSEDETRSAQDVYQTFDNNYVDAIIGPLFSEASTIYAKLADDYKIPTLAPLANSENLTQNTKHLFQINTPLKIQGVKLADYIADNMEDIDSLIVIAEKSTTGEVAANAFIDRYENLGGVVKHKLIEDYSRQGYLLFNNDSDIVEDLKSNNVGIFASFTGAASTSLIKSLLTELESSRNKYNIFGTEEWDSVNLFEYQLPGTTVHYTQSITHLSIDNSKREFIKEFKNQYEVTPNEFAFIGYDVASLIISELKEVQNPDYLTDALRNLELYEGINAYIGFDGEQSNNKVKIYSKP